MAAFRAPPSSQLTQALVADPVGELIATKLDGPPFIFAGMLTDAMASPVVANKVVTCKV